jgi:hypothetical protein
MHATRPYEGLICCDAKRIWEYSRTLHMGIQPYASYGHTAVLFLWAYNRTLHIGIMIQLYSYYGHTTVLFIRTYSRTLHTGMGNAIQYFHHVLRTTIWPIKMHMSYVYIIVVIPLLQGLIQVKKRMCRNMRFWSSRRKCRHEIIPKTIPGR